MGKNTDWRGMTIADLERVANAADSPPSVVLRELLDRDRDLALSNSEQV